MLVVAITQFDGGDPYPGWRAVVPVAATALLILAGSAPSSAVMYRALAADPMQRLGRVSYSWYLWHWPLMVLAVSFFDNDSTWLRVLAVGVALPVAAVVYHGFEQRIRFLPQLTGSMARTFVLGAAVTILTIVAATGVLIASEKVTDRSPYRELVAAVADQGEPCAEIQDQATGERLCVLGDLNSSTTVMLIGDSHAEHWQASLGTAAEELGVRLVVRWFASCPGVPARVSISGQSSQPDERCEQFQDETDRLVEVIRPAAVIMSQARPGDRMLTPDGDRLDPALRGEVWSAALENQVERIRRGGSGVGMIDFSPLLPENPITCMAKGGTVPECSVSREVALADDDGVQAAQTDSILTMGVPVFEPDAHLCDDALCHVEIDGLLTYRDTGHLTHSFTETQVPGLVTLLQESLSSANP